MSEWGFNKGMDDCFDGAEPNRRLMENDRDYSEGYHYADSIEREADERHRYEKAMQDQYEKDMQEEYNKYCEAEYKEYLKKERLRYTKAWIIARIKRILRIGRKKL